MLRRCPPRLQHVAVASHPWPHLYIGDCSQRAGAAAPVLCMTLSVPRRALGWEMGQSPRLAGASTLLHLGEQQGLPAPAVLRAASVTSRSPMADGWCRLTSFLLEGLPFPSAFSSPALLGSLSSGCWSRMGNSACSGHVNRVCTHGVTGGSRGRGQQEGCSGTFPGLRSARAIWPLHLLAACITLSLAYVLGWRLQPPHLSCVLLKEKLKGSCLACQPCPVLASSFPWHREH